MFPRPQEGSPIINPPSGPATVDGGAAGEGRERNSGITVRLITAPTPVSDGWAWLTLDLLRFRLGWVSLGSVDLGCFSLVRAGLGCHYIRLTG